MKKYSRIGIIIPILLILVSTCGCFSQNNDLNSQNNHDNFTNNLGKNNRSNTTYIILNFTNNRSYTISQPKYDFSKSVDINKIFLNLSYTKEMNFKDKIIKKYGNITFVVSKDPIDFSNAYIYNNVRECPERDKFGYYMYYKFTPKNDNLSVSYCYYRKVGNYYILLQTCKLDTQINDLWEEWSSYAFDLFKVSGNISR